MGGYFDALLWIGFTIGFGLGQSQFRNLCIYTLKTDNEWMTNELSKYIYKVEKKWSFLSLNWFKYILTL